MKIAYSGTITLCHPDICPSAYYYRFAYSLVFIYTATADVMWYRVANWSLRDKSPLRICMHDDDKLLGAQWYG